MSESGRSKHIDLSVSQVAGGGLATLVAATAAAYLGVYGTIAGAAVMSVLSTAGTAVAQRFLKESGDRARTLAVRAKRPPRHQPPGTGDAGAASTTGGAHTELGDRDATQAFPAVAGTAYDGGGEDACTAGDSDPGVAETRAMPAVGGPGDAPDDNGADGSGNGDSGEDPQDDTPSFWQRWRTPIITAGVIFVLVMVVILAFELLTGRSLSDTVHGRDTHSGPSMLGGQSQNAPDHEPEQGPSSTPGTGTGAPQEEGTTDQPRTSEPGGQQDQEDDSTEQPAPAPPDGDSDTGGETGDGTGDDTGGDTGGQDDGPGSQEQQNSGERDSGQGGAGMARPEGPPQQ